MTRPACWLPQANSSLIRFDQNAVDVEHDRGDPIIHAGHRDRCCTRMHLEVVAQDVRSTRDSRKRQLEEIVRSTGWLMRALASAREVDAPDWLIGAGAIRTAVWDRLHDHPTPTPLADVDIGFFDPDDLSEARDHEIEGLLEKALPGVGWDAKNQAAVHLWYPGRFGHQVEPFESSAAAVATWPETAACVALRLTSDDRLLIHAPLGLDDLFGMVWRRNPARVTVEEYQRRLATKRIAEKWPRVTIVTAEGK